MNCEWGWGKGIEEDREEPEEFCQEQKEEKECVVANQNNEARTIASIDQLSMELCSKGSTFYANFWWSVARPLNTCKQSLSHVFVSRSLSTLVTQCQLMFLNHNVLDRIRFSPPCMTEKLEKLPYLFNPVSIQPLDLLYYKRQPFSTNMLFQITLKKIPTIRH